MHIHVWTHTHTPLSLCLNYFITSKWWTFPTLQKLIFVISSFSPFLSPGNHWSACCHCKLAWFRILYRHVLSYYLILSAQCFWDSLMLCSLIVCKFFLFLSSSPMVLGVPQFVHLRTCSQTLGSLACPIENKSSINFHIQ
jgi:hypothetical protein